jgi:hypothetical protein
MKRIGNGLTGFFISKGLISLKYTLRYVCTEQQSKREQDHLFWHQKEIS